MLNSHREQPGYESESRPSETSPLDMAFTIARIARRQVLVIGLVTVLGTAFGALIAYTTPPAYTAEASILVETRKVQLFSGTPVIDDSSLGGLAMDTEIEILRSDRIVLSVIDALHLFDDPEFVDPPEGLVVRIRALLAQRFGIGSLEPRQAPAGSPAERRRTAIQTFQSRLDLNRIGGSYGIAIRFRSSDPQKAAQIANAVAAAFIAGQRDIKSEASAGAASWLQQRLREVQDQSVAADQAVLDFKVRNKIVTARGQLLDDQQLSELNGQVLQARSRTADARARLDRIEAVIASNAADPANGATVTDALNNPVITRLRSQSIELASRLNDWTARFGAQHLAVLDLKRQLQDLRLSMLNELKRLAETYKSEFEIAQQRQTLVDKQFADSVSDVQTANQAQSTLRELESAAQTYHTLYDTFLQRYAEAAQQQSFPISDATILTRAPVPEARSQPKTRLLIGFAAFASALLGCGAGLLREMMDRVFRTAEQVETTLQTDCIAMVPSVTLGDNKRAGRPLPRPTLIRDARVIQRRPDVMWSAADRPHSRFADALRVIKASVDFGLRSPCKVVGITSSEPGEGKSVTAAALALLMAEIGARVLLVDGDLHRTTLSHALAPEAGTGLPDVVADQSLVGDALWTDTTTGLRFLPGCVGPLPPHSNELLASPAMRALFDTLRANYDYIVVDLPPLVPLLDVRATAHIVDGYALVVAWGQTKVHTVEHALKGARGIQDALLGVVLSKVDVRRLRRYAAAGANPYGRSGLALDEHAPDVRAFLPDVARKRIDA